MRGKWKIIAIVGAVLLIGAAVAVGFIVFTDTNGRDSADAARNKNCHS